MADIFISYSRKDSDQALMLADQLRTNGLTVWVDQHGIFGAEHWATEIVEGISSCSTFLVLLSPSSTESENVLKELTLAFEKQKRILPVELQSVSLPSSFEYPLAGLQRVAISDFPAILRAHKHGISKVLRKDSRKSLMILPFEDLSPASEDNTWFADGLTVELISALSNIKSLRIPDRRTSMEFKGFRGKTTEIARDLNVRYFIEGNVRKFSDQIKISVELLDIDTGDYLWQHSYRGQFKDIFEIQETLAREVVHGLELHLTSSEEQKVIAKRTENPLAYEHFLKAGEEIERNTKQGFERALYHYLEAGRLDVSFASAFIWGANAHLALYRSYDRNVMHLEEAERLIETGQRADPNDFESLSILSRLRMFQGRTEEAEKLAKKCVVVSPDGNSYFALGYFYYQTGRAIEAAAAYQECIHFRPNYLTAHWNLIAAYNRLGDHVAAKAAAGQAIPLFEKRLKLFPDDEHASVWLANIYFFDGRSEKVLELLESLKNVKDADSHYNLGCLAAKAGKLDLAMQYLMNARARGFVYVEAFRNDPDLDSLREREDFQTMIEELEGAHV